MDWGGGESIVLKVFGAIALIVAALVACSEARSMPMALTDQQRAEIHRFANTPHFAASEDYVGFLSEDVVENPEEPIRELAQKIENSSNLTTESALDEAGKVLALYRLADTEDREQAARTVARLLKIAKVDLPEGWLDDAVYGQL